MDYLSEIDAMIEEKSLLKHPLYQAWARGELNQEILKDYAEQYAHHVSAFPRYVSQVHANTPCPVARKALLENLIEEEGGSPNHPELWQQFVVALGGTNEKRAPSTAVKSLIDTFFTWCRKGSATGIAALYAYESQIPAICESKIDGLKKFYGMTNPKSWYYFTLHIEADKEHAADERKMLERAVTSENFMEVKQGVQAVLDGLWNLLSSISEKHGIVCSA